MSEQLALVPYERTGRSRSLEEWAAYLGQVYAKANKGLPWWGYERRVLRHALELTNPQHYHPNAIGEFDRLCGWFFAWFCGMLSALKITEISKLVYLEFPEVCPRCFRSSCYGGCSKKRDRVRANRLGAQKLAGKPAGFAFDLQGLAEHATAIYPDNKELDLGTLAGRFAGEVRELSEGVDDWVRHKKTSGGRCMDKVREELPDVLMWFSSLWYVAQMESAVAENSVVRPLDSVLWEIFEIGCPRCSPKTGVHQCVLCRQGEIDRQQYFSDLTHARVIESGDHLETIDAEFEVKDNK